MPISAFDIALKTGIGTELTKGGVLMTDSSQQNTYTAEQQSWAATQRRQRPIQPAHICCAAANRVPSPARICKPASPGQPTLISHIPASNPSPLRRSTCCPAGRCLFSAAAGPARGRYGFIGEAKGTITPTISSHRRQHSPLSLHPPGHQGKLFPYRYGPDVRPSRRLFHHATAGL